MPILKQFNQTLASSFLKVTFFTILGRAWRKKTMEGPHVKERKETQIGNDHNQQTKKDGQEENKA